MYTINYATMTCIYMFLLQVLLPYLLYGFSFLFISSLPVGHTVLESLLESFYPVYLLEQPMEGSLACYSSEALISHHCMCKFLAFFFPHSYLKMWQPNIFSFLTNLYPGTYALIGAASFLGGVVRMTISLTAILIESTNELSLGLPVMISILVRLFLPTSLPLSHMLD